MGIVGSLGMGNNGKNSVESDKPLVKDLRKTIEIGDITFKQISNTLCPRHYTINPDTCFKECVLGRFKICSRETLDLDKLALHKEERIKNPFYSKGE